MPDENTHIKSAKRTVAKSAIDDDFQAGFPSEVEGTQQLHEIAGKQLSCLATRAIGPDIFVLLPDLAVGNIILTIIRCSL
jgi:hypothetical protein